MALPYHRHQLENALQHVFETSCTGGFHHQTSFALTHEIKKRFTIYIGLRTPKLRKIPVVPLLFSIALRNSKMAEARFFRAVARPQEAVDFRHGLQPEATAQGRLSRHAHWNGRLNAPHPAFENSAHSSCLPRRLFLQNIAGRRRQRHARQNN